MFITIAVNVIVIATFLLIMVNMYSDYSARREQDMRLLITRAHNIISESEELLLNQAQLPYSKTLVLILHYRIIRALKKTTVNTKLSAQINERIQQEEKTINEIRQGYKEELAFRPPDNDTMAINQLRSIRKLRSLIKNELKAGTPVNPADVQKEDRRLYLLVIKVNISNLVQRVLEMKRLHQIGSCRQLIAKGLEVIQKSGIKNDGWLTEKQDLLVQLQNGLLAETETDPKNAAGKNAKTKQQTEDEKEIDALFGEKKKW